MIEDASPGDVDPTSLDLRSRASAAGSTHRRGDEISHAGAPDAVAIATLASAVAAEGLDRLRRAGISAYLDRPSAAADAATGADGVRTIYAPGVDREDALTVLATLGGGVAAVDPAYVDPPGGPDATDNPADGAVESSAAEIDAAFAALVADLDLDLDLGRTAQIPPPEASPSGHPDYHDLDGVGPVAPQGRAAIDDDLTALSPPRSGDIRRRLADEEYEDPVELREEHYVPQIPPPVPRPTAAAAVALIVILVGLGVLVFGDSLHIAPGRTMTTGILIILAGGGLLAARIKRYRDETDDGAVL